MSDKLSSEAAQGFAIAGAAILALILANQGRKRLVSAWRNWRSNEKPETEQTK